MSSSSNSASSSNSDSRGSGNTGSGGDGGTSASQSSREVSLRKYIYPTSSASSMHASDRLERISFFAMLRQRWHATMQVKDPFSFSVPFAVPADPYTLVQIVSKHGGFNMVEDWSEVAGALGSCASKAMTIKRFYETKLLKVLGS